MKKFDTCPNGMYPMDSNYENEEPDLESLIKAAEAGSDSLNFPIGWTITKDSDYELEDDKFEVVFLMPRKYGKTWSIYTENFDYDRAVEWVLDFTKRAATDWYGWDE